MGSSGARRTSFGAVHGGAATAALLAALWLSPVTARAQTACEVLAALPLAAGATVTSAVSVPASADGPAFCNVLATVAPQTDIQVRLPLAWAGRYLHLGGACFDGVIPGKAPATSGLNLLAEGFAVAASNGGHRDSQHPGASFAGDRVLVAAYARTSISDTDEVAIALMRAMYGRDPAYRYFDGCSNGGKNASVAASALAAGYDGVIGGDGVYGHASDRTGGSDMPGLTSVWVRAAQLARGSFKQASLRAKTTALYQAEVARCDALDGLTDGIISNPGACRFDPAELLCPAGTDAAGCLTPTELQAVRTVTSDLTVDGRVVGAPFGLGDLGGGPGGGALGGGAERLGQGFLAFAYGEPAAELSGFDQARDYPRLVAALDDGYGMAGPLASAAGVGLADFLRKGGKLILWTGGEDEPVPAVDSIRFHQALQARLDPGAAANERLYVLPGVQHCGGGPGADSVDLLTPLTRWVEQGTAPATPTAFKLDPAGTVAFSRPLCPFPQWPAYLSSGDPKEAASFRCTDPAAAGQDGPITR